MPLRSLPVHTNPAGRRLVVSDGANPESDKMSTVMSTVRREGGWRVRAHTVANTVMGDTSISGLGDHDPTMPTIVLKGTNIMGDTKVRGPKKPSRWRKALT